MNVNFSQIQIIFTSLKWSAIKQFSDCLIFYMRLQDITKITEHMNILYGGLSLDLVPFQATGCGIQLICISILCRIHAYT